ncbi:nucleotidyltransferase domain-containing protein [Allochromatium vinosum]|uniref:nucleotidyltransferase domain-containing protein n=1 Tax=Allochromatium vinosum TaxID=1049 RepID=UPI001F5C03BD|nr:nucleotidyltransferase domain-containing protein [Allochromatium vinosum]
MTAMPQSAGLDAVHLDADEIAAIEQAAKRYLAPGSRVGLFGSRLDANRRGGDIDLLVEPLKPLTARGLVERRNCFIADLYRLLGERRIDVVMAPIDVPDERAVVEIARRDGVVLVEVPTV